MEKKSLKEAFYSYTDFTNIQAFGSRWIGEVIGWFPIGGWIASASIYQIALWGIGNINFWFIHIDMHNIKYWMILLFLAIKFYVMILLKWLVGKIAVKIGLIRAEQNYESKTEHISPMSYQSYKTMENIAKKVGARSEFTKL